MTIRHLRIFIEVAECGKMSKAAEKLFISQPTVSQAIMDLEKHYEVLLFERLNKRIYITDEGKKLLFYAKDVVNQFDALEEKMFNMNKNEKIRIGATITISECILSDIINRLQKRNPVTEIYSCANNTEVIEAKLLKGEIDIGLVEGRIKSKDLIVIPEVSDYLVLTCSMNHPFSRKKEIKLKELEDENFAMREQGSGTRELFEEYMLRNGINIKTAFEGNSPEAIKLEVINNNCLAVISICLVEKEVKNSTLHIIECSEGSWDRHFSIVYHKDKKLTGVIKTLIDITKNYKYIPNNMKYNSGKLIK